MPESLIRFVTPALFYHEGQPVMDLSAPGTAFRFRYRDKNFVIFCRHQLGAGASKLEPSAFTLVVEEGLGLSPNRVARLTTHDTDLETLEDICIVEFDDEREGRNIRPFFLDIDLGRNLNSSEPSSMTEVFALGFPTYARDGRFEEDEDGLPTKWLATARGVKLYLKVDTAKPLDTENRIPMVQDARIQQKTIDPDGMSGAPVFFTEKTSTNDIVHCFAGMVTNANGRRYMVYNAAIIKLALDRYIDMPDESLTAVDAE